MFVPEFVFVALFELEECLEQDIVVVAVAFAAVAFVVFEFVEQDLKDLSLNLNFQTMNQLNFSLIQTNFETADLVEIVEAVVAIVEAKIVADLEFAVEDFCIVELVEEERFDSCFCNKHSELELEKHFENSVLFHNHHDLNLQNQDLPKHE